MWLLKKLSDGTTKYLLSRRESYTVGRKNCDIVLEDVSVSRRHCTFFVARLTEDCLPASTLTTVCVIDEQSKYGTFLKSSNNWVQIKPKERKNLTSGSIIKFGLLENNWRLEYKPIVACASGVPPEQKKKIETILQSIDGCLKNSWCKECSLVIVNEITLTVKVVLALINGVPVVTPDYIEIVAHAVREQIEFPSYENYHPVIKETILDKALVSLDTKNHRRDLFKGKTFVIPTRKQLETLKDVIKCAGGNVELLSSNHDLTRLAKDDVVLIQLPVSCSGIPEEQITSFKKITSLLKNNYERRAVPESEIAQAVAYSSIEKFCNPKSSCFNLRIAERKQLDLGPLLIEETPLESQELNRSQLGVVFTSATNSETPVPTGTQLTANKTAESVSTDLSQHNVPVMQQEPQKPQRKRTLDWDKFEDKIQNKKARNSDISANESGQELSTEKGSMNGSDEDGGKACTSKTVEIKSSRLTNDSQKRNGLLPLAKIRVARQSSSDFWDFGMVSKRKNLTESHDSGQDSSRKKVKLLEKLDSTHTSPENNAKDVVESVLETDNSKNGNSFPPSRDCSEREDDFTDYFGRDTLDEDTGMEELNSTILSLAIIPPSFLKEDGSLVDPPDVPVNVKKFKKQKVFPLPPSNDTEDELSDGEWIEPHRNRLNISILEENID